MNELKLNRLNRELIKKVHKSRKKIAKWLGISDENLTWDEIFEVKRKIGKSNYDETSEKLLAEIKNLKKLRNEITTLNLGFVIKIVNLMQTETEKGSLEFEDLIQEGIFGLWRAIEKFDPERNITFASYARYWIFQAVKRAIAQKKNLIRIPEHIPQKKRRYHRLLTKGVSKERISKELQVSPEILQKVIEAPYVFLSLYEKNENKNDGKYFLEETTPSYALSPDKLVYNKELRKKITEILKTLSPKEQIVIKKRFGLDEKTYGERHTFQEIGEELGLTRQRIEQIEKKALSKIYRYLRKSDL